MRRILPLLLLASVFAAGAANASAARFSYASLVKAAQAQVPIPPEWDGIWDTVDTVYTCQGAFQSTGVGSDTLCGGADYSSENGNIVFECQGTANATTIDLTCTGSGEISPGCHGDFNMVMNGTRTSSSYFTVSTINGTFTGVACGLLTSSCIQVNNHGTKSGPTTVADCVTPTKHSTWGELKVIYR